MRSHTGSRNNKKTKIKISALALCLLFLMPFEARPQSHKPMTLSELATYNGVDREQVLYAGAKAEGKVVWYTSLAGESYKAMVKAFEAKYPGVKVEAYRGSGHELTTRMMEEAKARKSIVDAVETTEANLMFMREAFLLRPYYSPYFASYPEDAKEKGERGLYFWGIARESYIGFAYNTKLLSKNAIPKNYEGLLHPELKGRMGMSVNDPSYKVVGAIIRTRGVELVKKLKTQEIALHTIIPPALLDLIASGEVLASPPPAIFRNHTPQCHREGRAGGMGSDGYRAHQRRRCCYLGTTAPPPRCLTFSGLSFGAGRPRDAGKIRIRQRGKESRFQTLATRTMV
jgi:Bacterial extracellular solute-binding protein